ncbi:MAG TPA: orotidine-5'-phosphate decarboxylase [Polyangiaceae bacterium]|nr:orotidine-5'-phosphate decarboxylase [Polyangiaceae bacterium]
MPANNPSVGDSSVDAAARRCLAFPLDYPDLASARRGAEVVHSAVGVLKVGLELFVREGPPCLKLGSDFGVDIFLDLKLHDIPQTVERAVGSACQLGAKYLTLHAQGGSAMIEAAASRASKENTGLQLLAVTVLTSIDQADLKAIGVDATPADQVLRLAALALGSGAHGLVCSPLELRALRTRFGNKPILVTPGIRAQSEKGADDQKRTGSAFDAIVDGSSLLVVGRPIRDAADPAGAARALCAEISRAQRALS